MKKPLCVALFFFITLNLFAQQGKDYLELDLDRTSFPDWGLPFPAGQILSNQSSNILNQYSRGVSYSRQVTNKMWLTVSYSYFNGAPDYYYINAGFIYERKLNTIDLSSSFSFYKSDNSKFIGFVSTGLSIRKRKEEKIDSIIPEVVYSAWNYPVEYDNTYSITDIGVNMSVGYKFNFYKFFFFGNEFKFEYFNAGEPSFSLSLNVGTKF